MSTHKEMTSKLHIVLPADSKPKLAVIERKLRAKFWLSCYFNVSMKVVWFVYSAVPCTISSPKPEPS